MKASIRKPTVSFLALATLLVGVACDVEAERETAAAPQTIVTRAAIERGMEDVTDALRESELCSPEGVPLDEVFVPEGASAEYQLAARLVEERLEDLDAEQACQESTIDGLTIEGDDDVAAGCEYTNTGVCSGCIGGYKACTYCFTGSWYCPVFGCDAFVPTSCSPQPVLAE